MKVHSNLRAFIFTLWLTQTAAVFLSKTGNITLFSDTNCQEPVYVNSFILGTNVCGKEDSATPPSFDIYSDSACTDMMTSNSPEIAPDETEIENPPCVAPGDFKGMAFVCEDDEDYSSTSTTPTASEEASKTTSVTTSASTLGTSSSVLGSSTSTTTASSSNTSNSSSTTPVQTSVAAPMMDGGIIMKLVLLLPFLAATI
ncbi:uncharacterized protein F4822DRAFT_431620 [Hypoxylon trugodes]|uniref:uncharacterized protein n=1 Tax=Hypoxylon trugodes TaxID=326681 RepID=UPI00219043D6|nr:uncharacterized protein F4822DRAFT_431620 [Hypoxylon trugodes]KAI1386752.1 hypothetical protein F4822DRAFT_431620 [Hypoxylon trugodes]